MGKKKDLQIIEAATSVFLRYGFRRSTMGDLAEAAGISRPSLYLRFCNKEKLFEAVLQEVATRTLDEIRAGLAQQETPSEQLRFAFECWAVKPFKLMQGSPDARDLTSCSLAFAEPVKSQSMTAFEALLVPILQRLPGFRGQTETALGRVAHVLTLSVHGFKAEAKDSEELRDMIETLLALVAEA